MNVNPMYLLTQAAWPGLYLNIYVQIKLYLLITLLITLNNVKLNKYKMQLTVI